MKRLLFVALAVLAMAAATAQDNSPETEGWRNDFGVDMGRRCLVFSSLEYRDVLVFDNDGGFVSRTNLRKAARRQYSDLVFVCFDEWEDGRYTVVAELKGQRGKAVRAELVKKDDMIIVIQED